MNVHEWNLFMMMLDMMLASVTKGLSHTNEQTNTYLFITHTYINFGDNLNSNHHGSSFFSYRMRMWTPNCELSILPLTTRVAECPHIDLISISNSLNLMFYEGINCNANAKISWIWSPISFFCPFCIEIGETINTLFFSYSLWFVACFINHEI